MGSEWRSISLREAGIELIDCDHRTPKALSTGFPYIAIPQLKDGRIELGDVRLISHEDYVDWTRKLVPREHDVIVVRRCSSGDSAVIPKGLKCAIGQNLVVLRADGHTVLPEFVRWLVRGDEWWEQVRKFMNVGAVFNSLKCKDIPNFEVIVPPTEAQQQIVQVLTSLDDKILLLKQTNVTLEAIAQALFKSWFVDFDPVRAKADGRDPEGVSAEVADLFPSEFEDSELGTIPKGWRVDCFGGIAEVLGGSTPSTKEPSYWEGGVHAWVTPKDLSGMDSPVLLETERRITDSGLRTISSGLLPAGSVLLSSRAPIGYLAISEIPVAVNQGFIAMKPKNGMSNLFILNLVRHRMEDIKSHANGSTFMEISKSAFRPIQVVAPPASVLNAFDAIARSHYDRMVLNQKQAASLTELRDTLLPRLMSGKLRIPEPDGVLE